MPAPAAYHVHGEDTGTGPERWNERFRGKDTLELECYAPTRDHAAYAVGQPAPGYPHMRIVEAARTEDVASWVHRLTCEGIASQTQDWKELSRIIRSPEEGWDEINLTIYTRKADEARWRKGARIQRADNDPTPVAGLENMYIVDRGVIHTDADGYVEIPLTLRGILGDKSSKRRIDGNSISSVSRIPSPGLALAATRYTDFPPTSDGTATLGLSEGDEVEYDAATIRVTDAEIYVGDPPFDKIGSPWTPPDPPDVVVLTISGEITKYYWPSGWKCVAMPAEKLAGANVWLLAVTWVYQVQTMPGRA